MVATQSTHETQIDLSLDTRLQMISLLNDSLASAFDLYSQIKQAHWNVKGMHFIALHELFDQLAAENLEFVDMIAERVTALAGDAQGTARMSAENSKLPEFPSDLTTGEEFVQAVVERVSLFSKHTRAGIRASEEADDMATSDLYTEVTRALDKQLYFLEAHLRA